MTWKTHLIGGATAGLVLANSIDSTSMTETALIIGASLLGSVLPDIDHQQSKLARGDAMVGVASAVVGRFTKHRGFTHTIPGAVVFAVATYILMMFNSAQQALIALASAFSGFILLQIFGSLRRYSVVLALIAYLVIPRLLPYLQGKAVPVAFSPGTAKLAAMGVFAGCISHMLYDTFNRRGIMWAFPLSMKPVRAASIRTRGVGEGLFASVMLVVFASAVVYYYNDFHVVDFIRGLWHELAAQVASL